MLALVLVLLLGCLFNADGAFFRFETHRDMLRQVSVFGILSCAMTLVIVTGGIDLSVGSILGVSSVVFSLITIHQEMNPLWAFMACLGLGTILGSISGLFVAKAKMQPFIATLAMMVFARGLAKWISGGQKISQAMALADGSFAYKEIPAIFEFLDKKIFYGHVAVVTVIFFFCALLCWLILSKTTWGRYLLAIGGNENTAALSRVPVDRMKVMAYGLSGLFCALAGICQAAQEQQGDPEAGMGYELNAIAMVVIGGNSLMGGKGGLGLTLLGVLIIGNLEKILSLNAVTESMRLMLTGLIIVLAVFLQKSKKA